MLLVGTKHRTGGQTGGKVQGSLEMICTSRSISGSPSACPCLSILSESKTPDPYVDLVRSQNGESGSIFDLHKTTTCVRLSAEFDS